VKVNEVPILEGSADDNTCIASPSAVHPHESNVQFENVNGLDVDTTAWINVYCCPTTIPIISTSSISNLPFDINKYDELNALLSGAHDANALAIPIITFFNVNLPVEVNEM
jgi:hypothetical protein